jgi:hypothetical protein
MSEQQAISTVLEALKLIAAGGIGGAIASCIGNWFVNKKLQAQKHEHDKQLESLKSNLQLETQKQVIEYTSLHDKQAQIIADFYARLSDLYGCIQRLMGAYRMREIKEQIEKENPDLPAPPKQIALTAEEQKAIDAEHTCNKELFEFYRRNKIYLSLVVCELTDRFYGLASYLAMEYHSVTFKDRDGKLYVNSEVKEVWDKAIETIPKLLIQLEKEFRGILGVKS